MARAAARKISTAFEPDFVCMYARDRRIHHTNIFLAPTYKGASSGQILNALEGFHEAPVVLSGLRKKSSMEEMAEILMLM